MLKNQFFKGGVKFDPPLVLKGLKFGQLQQKKHKIKALEENWTPLSDMRGKFYYHYTKDVLLVK